MYTVKNYRTKKAIKDDLAKGIPVEVFQPGPFAPDEPIEGTVSLEGPHYPEPHRWYARALVSRGLVTKIIS